MKRILGFLFLTLALAAAASASSSVDFSNGGGTLTGSNTGLSLSSSTLIAVNGLDGLGLVTGNLGSVTFSTGALSSGDLQMGGTFASGGSFVITGNGTGGIPNGVMFSGSFSTPVVWSMVTLANGTHNYIMTGVLSGTWVPTGTTVDGVTVQLTVNTGKGFFNGSTFISSGDTDLSLQGVTRGTVPEPSSLILLGSGLFGIGGVLRFKLKKNRQTDAKDA